MPMEQLLVDVFDTAEEEGISYCLLRGYDELLKELQEKEIDLLVSAKHLSLFENIVTRLGFVSLPAWGYAPHHFYVAYDDVHDTWLKLDVVTDTVFGKPIRYLRANLAARCLANRVKQEMVFVMAPEDELIALLLHCLLDKEGFRKEHTERLRKLLQAVRRQESTERMAMEYVDRFFPKSFNWQSVTNTINRADWPWLTERRLGIARKLFWRNPVMSIYRKLKTIFVRGLRPILFLLRRQGISVALLAPDGAGKSTLAGELTQIRYLRPRVIYMGSNSDSSNVGLPTTRWLKTQVRSLGGKRWSPKRDILRAINFTNRLFEQWFRFGVGMYHKMFGRLVIFDRYTYDSYLAPPAKSPGKRMRRWLLKHACPSPNMVLLLDAPGKILYHRKREHSPEILENQRRVFLNLKKIISNMVVLDATRNPHEVRREAMSKIWSFYGHHVLKCK